MNRKKIEKLMKKYIEEGDLLVGVGINDLYIHCNNFRFIERELDPILVLEFANNETARIAISKIKKINY